VSAHQKSSRRGFIAPFSEPPRRSAWYGWRPLGRIARLARTGCRRGRCLQDDHRELAAGAVRRNAHRVVDANAGCKCDRV